MRGVALSVLAAMLAATPAFADSVGSETQWGKDFFAETLSYDGASRAVEDRDRGLVGGIDAMFVRTRTTVSTVNGDRTLTDSTRGLDANLGWRDHRFDARAGLTYSATPDEGLHDDGVTLEAHYGVGRGPDDASLFKFGVNAARTRYVADFRARTRTGIARSGLSLNQTAGGVDASFNPLSWFQVFLSYTAYRYDRDVAKFASNLDLGRFLPLRLARFGTTLASFPSHSTDVGVALNPNDNWSIDADQAQIRSAADGTLSFSTRLVVTRHFAHWDLGLGAERDQTAGVNDNSALINAYYYF